MKWIYVCLVVVVVLINAVAPQYGGMGHGSGQPTRHITPVSKPKPRPRPKPTPTPTPARHTIKHTQHRQPMPTKGPFDICDVGDRFKIQCGPADISASACSAINCCWDGEMCYYGTSVTLQCTKDGQFILVVAKESTLPNIDTDSITLLGEEQGCHTVAANSAFAIYQFPCSSCGTIMTEEPGVITYENRMTSSYEVAVGPRGSITRDSTFELVFQCKYTANSIVALVVDAYPPVVPQSVAAEGPLHVELRVASGRCDVKGCNLEQVVYNSYYSAADYPVTKVLRDAVYIDVVLLGRTDPNLFLTLGQCWATTIADPLSLPQWDMLVDGCPSSNDRYVTKLVKTSTDVPVPSHHSRFAFKMFTFVDDTTMMQLREKMFIHCQTTLCVVNCAPQCYRNRKRRSTTESATNSTTSTTTTTTTNIAAASMNKQGYQNMSQHETVTVHSGELNFISPDF